MTTTDSEKTKLKAIGALFVPGAFPRQEQEGTERQLLQIYLMAVEDIPAGFVGLAAKRFIQGQVVGVSVTFRPTPAEFAVEARKLQERAGKRERIAALPNRQFRMLAKPEPADPTPEERQRCAEVLLALKADLKAAGHDNPLLRNEGRYKAPPVTTNYTPRVDISDFPEPGWSPERLRDWEARQKDAAA